jgi:hypothetical protein
MPAIIEGPPEPGAADGRPLWRKLAWFVGLALASTAATAAVAYGLRALIL